jgi:multidrug efflux pump subunit AcrA (membrane-fusion protein)
VTEGPLSVWSEYTGHVEAREVVELASRLGGSAIIVYLAPEGTAVKKGDVLARFDTTDAERELVKLNQDYATAESEMESLEKAELPIERSDLQLQVDEQANKVKLEDKFITDSEDLVKQGLMSEEELGQERTEADKEHRELTSLQAKLDLTIRYLQPLKVQQARTKLLAAQQALALGKRQLEDSTISAPEAGVLEFRPIPIGGEYRMVRVGDSVFQNQGFMYLPDTHSLVVHCEVPEAEFDHVPGGAQAVVRPLARPDVQIQGRVQSVGSVARNVPDQPSWQHYFQTIVALDPGGNALKPGMTVSVQVLSYHTESAILLPREALRWEAGEPYVLLKGAFGTHRRAVRVGHSDLKDYEILDGLKPGDSVLTQ